MCYSAMIWADYRKYVRRFGATLSLKEFAELYLSDEAKQRKLVRTPKAMDMAFAQPATADEQALNDAIVQRNKRDARELEQELFKQSRRNAHATRSLHLKATKKAQDDLRISTSKIEQLKVRLSDLKRGEPAAKDSRIYPGSIAPVMLLDHGQRVIKPMRYQCRIAGVPAAFDRKYPGTYNARRDSLGRYWRNQFAHTHAVIVATAFFEHVVQDGENVVLEFRPGDGSEMIVACLWSHWTGTDGGQMDSFAAITDEPPAEVAAAGHDRCIIPIKPEYLDAWLDPQGDVETMQAVLDDRARPLYEHRMAA